MSIQTRPYYSWAMLNLLLFIASIKVITINGLPSRKLHESKIGDSSVKCTSCEQYPPPRLPPPPPPSPKKPPSTYCPPPPSPPTAPFISIVGPPGSLYPIDQDFNGASQNKYIELPTFLLYGILVFIAFW